MKEKLSEKLIRVLCFLHTLFVLNSCLPIVEKGSLKIDNESIKSTVRSFIKISNSTESTENEIILLSVFATEQDTSVYLKNSAPYKCEYYVGFEVIDKHKVLIFTNLPLNNSNFSYRKRNVEAVLCDEVSTNDEYGFAYEEFYSLKMGQIVSPTSDVYIIP